MIVRIFPMRSVFVFAAILALSSQCVAAASGTKIDPLNLPKILRGRQACTMAGSAQFISESALLLLVGPDSDCYRHVSDLELVVVSTDGRVIARKPEPSTFPGVILAGGRIVVNQLNRVTVLDSRLQTIQTIDLPLPDKPTSFYPRRIGTDLLAIRDMRGPVYIYSGAPLQLVSSGQKDVSLFRTFTLQGGQIVKLTDKSLAEKDTNGQDHDVATLSWVNPCDRLCQAYDAGLNFSVASESTNRILVISNGSRFPVTDAAGLFPYFRIEVFNLHDGASVYREQFVTKTGHRTADISPEGDLLAINDGTRIEFRKLN